MTKTKTTIKENIVVFLVVLGVIAAMSQLFFDVNDPKVIETRKNHKEVRNKRDSERIQGMKILEDINAKNILPDSLSYQVSQLTTSHNYNQNKSAQLYSELKALKSANRVNNFVNWNTFFGAMGNPFFLLITGFLFLLLYIYRASINWLQISKCFIYLAFMYFFISLVYLIWGFTTSLEIHKIYYTAGLIVSGIFAAFALKKLLKYLFKVHTSIKEDNLMKAIVILFNQLLHNVPNQGYVKEEKFNEFTESNNRVISEVHKEVKENGRKN